MKFVREIGTRRLIKKRQRILSITELSEKYSINFKKKANPQTNRIWKFVIPGHPIQRCPEMPYLKIFRDLVPSPLTSSELLRCKVLKNPTSNSVRLEFLISFIHALIQIVSSAGGSNPRPFLHGALYLCLTTRRLDLA